MCLDQRVLRDGRYKAGLALTRALISKMIMSKRKVRSNHASYHFVFTKAACTNLQELPVEQDAVDVLHCGSTQNGCPDQKMA